MPTKKQAELLIFINKYMKKQKASPTFREMAKGLKYKSQSNIDRLLFCLEHDGYIRRKRDRARSIEIIFFPEWLKGK